jgi:hypothetical protein
MKVIEPRKTKKYAEHARIFSQPEHFSQIYENGNAFTLWSNVYTLRRHPASLKLFLDNFVRFYPKKENIREEIEKLFRHNHNFHCWIAEGINNNCSVLDIGAGIGCLKNILDERCLNVEYYAQDISEEFLRLNPAKDENKFCCDFEDLSKICRERKFDYVIDCRASHYKERGTLDPHPFFEKLKGFAEKKYFYVRLDDNVADIAY